MVLVLSRGAFCPKDRRQAEGLLELHREMEVGYCRLVTISTDNITETNEYRTGVGAHWPFLSDNRRIVQKDLDIAEYTDAAHNPMIPHVIVLKPGQKSSLRPCCHAALSSGVVIPSPAGISSSRYVKGAWRIQRRHYPCMRIS